MLEMWELWETKLQFQQAKRFIISSDYNKYNKEFRCQEIQEK